MENDVGNVGISPMIITLIYLSRCKDMMR